MKDLLPLQRPYPQKTANGILLNRYAPASVVVNEELEIVHFIDETSRFVEPAGRNTSLSLMKMVKPELHRELRLALQKARRSGTARKEGMVIEYKGGLKSINLEIRRMKKISGRDRHFLIIFEDAGRPGSRPAKRKNKASEKAGEKAANTRLAQIEMENMRLKQELDATREYLESMIEEQRATNEQVRLANEEIQSSNEELQSINEELETAKEELQSTNEDLTALNEELRNRSDELVSVNCDLNNLLSGVNIPILMLGNDLRIRRFTPMAEKVMNLRDTDVGRPITDIKPNFRVPAFREMVSRVINSLETHESEVKDDNGKCYSMRIRPCRTADNKSGVVIVLLDVETKGRPKAQ